MKKFDPNKPYSPFRKDSDEYYDFCDDIKLVLMRHFGEYPNLIANSQTQRFISSYENVMTDFWNKKQGTESLEALRRAVLALASARASLPWLLGFELRGNASFIDEKKREQFLAKTTQDIIFKSQLPEPSSSNGVGALFALAENHLAAIEAIDMALKNVPEGIETRNRPIQEWAIIEAAAEVARVVGAFDVPKAIDDSGPFYRLLSSLFEAFGYAKRSSLKGVYAGWRKHMDGKMDNFDLLDI